MKSSNSNEITHRAIFVYEEYKLILIQLFNTILYAIYSIWILNNIDIWGNDQAVSWYRALNSIHITTE